ncbi:MAG TPA: hypothetical protein DHV62_00455 [Elusimicrobia bacterium]|jgi:hypothetical protein|nr:hypothetical protein [Elusimicrobiota bacterium]
MLSLENLQEFTKKFQTNEKNVIREYIQHLCLANLYKNKESEDLLFKGGTSLRFIYQSPRFSEDLDFTGRFWRFNQIEDLFLRTLTEIEKIGIKISFKEAKPTTGGYLGLIHYDFLDFKEDMKFEVSLRKNKKIEGELTTLISDFTIPYTLIHLAPKELVNEKIQALINRGKPRDYYDLYFLLRHPALNRFVDKRRLKRTLDNLNKEQIDFKRELSVLLPVMHQMILKNFKEILRKEIEKHL